MSILDDARRVARDLGEAALLKVGIEDAILTALEKIGVKGVAKLAKDNKCSEGTARQCVGKAVREVLNARNTGRRRKGGGFSYTVLAKR